MHTKNWEWISEDTLATLVIGTEVGPPKDSSDWNAEVIWVGSVILNRLYSNKGEFRHYNSIKDVVLAKYQFSAVGERNWQRALTGDRNWAILLKKVETLWHLTKKIHAPKDAVLYYSPVSMKPLGSRPPWNFSLLEEVTPPEIDPNRFRFYRYK